MEKKNYMLFLYVYFFYLKVYMLYNIDNLLIIKSKKCKKDELKKFEKLSN